VNSSEQWHTYPQYWNSSSNFTKLHSNANWTLSYMQLRPHVERQLPQGEKNVQPDPRNTVPRLYLLSYPAAYTSSPLKSEQFWTVTWSFFVCVSISSEMVSCFNTANRRKTNYRRDLHAVPSLEYIRGTYVLSTTKFTSRHSNRLERNTCNLDIVNSIPVLAN
jgi:hypothetical protein